jgi:molybdenum cofactor biosynthesis protein B
MADHGTDHERDSHDDHDHGEHDDHGHHNSHNDHGHHDSHGHDDHGHHDHDSHHQHDLETVGVGIVTISPTRDPDEDPSGDLIADRFEEAGHEVVARELIPDDHDLIQGTVDDLVDRESVDAVVTTGGTGVTPDDVTPEAIEPLLDKSLPGFGELFRQLSYEEIGTMVVATRAVGGVADGVPVFALPGSTDAVRLGVEEIILPEIGHLAGLAGR